MKEDTDYIASDSNLHIIDKNSFTVVKTHQAVSSIAEFRRVKDNIIIIRLNTDEQVPLSNIYCLNDALEVVWYAELPFADDYYPNQIVWDSELNDNATSWEDYTTFNKNNFTSSSQKGVTVSISYSDGRIISRIFTK